MIVMGPNQTEAPKRASSTGFFLDYGERGRARTCDPCLKRALLYQLSYAPNLAKLVYHWRYAGTALKGCLEAIR